MLNFWLQNLAYVSYIILGFILVAVAWLHYDAHMAARNRLNQLKAAGFLLLALGMIGKVFVDVAGIVSFGQWLVMLLGLGLVMVAVWKEKILPSRLDQLIGEQHTQPHMEQQTTQLNSSLAIFAVLIPGVQALMSAVIAILMYRRLKLGKVREYKPLVRAFALLGIAFLLEATFGLQNSDVIALQTIFGKFGIVWLVAVLAYVGAAVCLMDWVRAYIKFRPKPQLFLAFAAVAVTIATLGALIYSGFLFSNTQADLFKQLQKDVNVLDLAVTNLQSNALTTAGLLAKNPQIVSAFTNNDYKALYDAGHLYAKEAIDIDSIIFTDPSAQVLMRTDNESQIGQSLTDDNLIVYAIKEAKERVSVVIDAGVLGQEVQVRAVQPVIGKGGKVIGVVQARVVIDDAFADKVKRETELEVAVYAGDKRAASTLLAPDGQTRRENTADTNAEVLDTVLKQGKDFAGSVKVINDTYHAAYAPLYNTNQEVVGMLFVGRPEQVLLDSVSGSLVSTFLVAIILAALSLVVAYKLAQSWEEKK